MRFLTTNFRILLAAIACAIFPISQAHACSTRNVAALFEYDARTQTVLDVEAAMARAQAEHSYVPTTAAEEITRQARVELVTQNDFDAEYAIVRHRMVALLNVWRQRPAKGS